MDYKDYNKDCDVSSPEDLVRKISDYVNNDSLEFEQKLFGIKLLLGDNSLIYVKQLKEKIKSLANKDYEKAVKSLNEQNENQKEKINRLREIIVELQNGIRNSKNKKSTKKLPRKKVVIKVKRPVSELQA